MSELVQEVRANNGAFSFLVFVFRLRLFLFFFLCLLQEVSAPGCAARWQSAEQMKDLKFPMEKTQVPENGAGVCCSLCYSLAKVCDIFFVLHHQAPGNVANGQCDSYSWEGANLNIWCGDGTWITVPGISGVMPFGDR